MVTPQEPTSTPTTAELISEVNALNAKVSQLSGYVNAQEEKAREEQQKKHTENRKTSRAAVTGVFAFLGAKVGALLGSRGGAIYHEMQGRQEHSNKEKLSAVIEEGAYKEFFRKLRRDKDARSRIIMGSVIGAAAGTMLLGALGWFRGNRIKDPTDLIKHPIKSLGNILGKKIENDAEQYYKNDIETPAEPPADKKWQIKTGVQNPTSTGFATTARSNSDTAGIIK